MWIVVLAGSICILSLALTVSAEGVVFDQQIFDERLDVADFDSEPETKGFVDIIWVKARYYEPSDTVIFEMRLVDGKRADAVYTILLTIDGMYHMTLGLEGDDNFTAQDDREGELDVTGNMAFSGEQISWSLTVAELNATSMAIIDLGRAELQVNGTARAWDTVEWDELDRDKGAVVVRIEYTFPAKNVIQRDVSVTYTEEATTEFKIDLDTNFDQYLSQDEIDAYREYLETDPGLAMTDMSLNFNQPNSIDFDLEDLTLEPGPIYGGSRSGHISVLTITYPEYDGMPYELRWELELHNILWIPYWRASDTGSYFKVVLPKNLAQKITFDREGQSTLIQGFFEFNDTEFSMTGPEMRANWNNTMYDHEGFHLLREEKGDGGTEDPSDDWCPINGMFLVAPAFVIYQGYMARSRRGRSLRPPGS